MASPMLARQYTGLRPTTVAPARAARPARAAAPSRPRGLAPVRAELDTTLVLGVIAGVAGLGLGVGIPIFYESAQKRTNTRDNDKPCFPCSGTGAVACRFCEGTGNVDVFAGDKVEKSKCINCEGKGAITCTTCQGTGIQPRYLDRREFVDDD